MNYYAATIASSAAAPLKQQLHQPKRQIYRQEQMQAR